MSESELTSDEAKAAPDTPSPDWDLDAIYDVLVTETGARDDDLDRQQFKMHWPACREYRFMGSLGFGGKLRAPRPGRPPYVNCYAEDVTPERLAIIERTNAALAAVARERDEQ